MHIRPAKPIYAKPMKYFSSFSASEKAILLIYIYFTEASLSASFAISGFPIQIKHSLGLLMTHTEASAPNSSKPST